MPQPLLRSITAFCIFFSQATLANNLSTNALAFTETDYLSDIPVVISATRLPERINEIPASVSIISREMIEASGAINIPDLLRLVPGFQVYQPTANKYAVSAHGLSDDFPKNLEVMVNGRSIYLPLLSTVDWQSIGITLNDVKEVEVIRGSNVPTHGANAFLGAINIITWSPLESDYFAASTTQGAMGTHNYDIRHADASDTLSYQISAGHQSNDGFDLARDSGQSRYLNLRSQLSPTLLDTLDVQIGASSGFAKVGDADYPDLYHNRDFDANYQLINWQHTPSPDQALQLQAFRNYLNLDAELISAAHLIADTSFQDSGGHNNPTALATSAVFAQALNADGLYFPADQEHGTTEVYDVELQYSYLPSDRLHLVVGSGYREQRAKSSILLNTSDYIDESTGRLFGNLKLDITESLIGHLGIMAENSSLSGFHISPRGAFNYQLSPRHTLRSSYTRAYRTPSLLEGNAYTQYLDKDGDPIQIISQPNPDLDAEQLDSYELGLNSRLSGIKGTVDLRVFREEVRDGIDSWFDTNKIKTLKNSADWTTQGAELQLSLTPTQTTLMHFAYGYSNSNGQRDRGEKGVESLDNRAPHHNASLLLSQKLPHNWIVSTTLYYQSEGHWLNGHAFDSMIRTDLKIAKMIDLSERMTGRFALLAHDLFNEQYFEFQRENQFGRRLFLQASLHY